MICTKVVHSWLGFGVGTKYSYDERGRIIQEINLDSGYDFTFEDILLFCRDNNINLLDNAGFPQTVYKESFKGIPAWRIIYHDLTSNFARAYILDGNTGIILWKVEDITPPPFEHLNSNNSNFHNEDE